MDLNTVITFGKFRDKTVASLKSSAEGQSYLEWGVTNLSDSRMRALFSAALGSLTDHERAVALSQSDEIGYDEALTHIRDMDVMAAEDAAELAREAVRQREIFARWSAESGVAVEKLISLSNQFGGYFADIPRARFSSPKAYSNFQKYMKEIWG